MTRIIARVAVLFALTSSASAQPVGPRNLQRVAHSSEMTGDGSTTSPLGLTKSCSTGRVLQWSGSAWVCSASSGVIGSGTSSDITVWTGSGTIGNYPGSTASNCTTGQAVTGAALSAAGVLTSTCTTLIAGTANTLQKSNGSNGLVDGWAVDDATTWGVASKFTITEASGNAKAFGTLESGGAFTGDSTGSFAGALNMNSNKITSLTNGSSAQDAAAFGQIATAVDAAVSGTSGRVGVFSGTNAMTGYAGFTSDSSGNVLEASAGIGAALSSGNKLHVQGNSASTGGWYVEATRTAGINESSSGVLGIRGGNTDNVVTVGSGAVTVTGTLAASGLTTLNVGAGGGGGFGSLSVVADTTYDRVQASTEKGGSYTTGVYYPSASSVAIRDFSNSADFITFTASGTTTEIHGAATLDSTLSVGTITANNGFIYAAAGENYFYGSYAASSGNQGIDLDSSGTGIVRINSNAGGLTNTGTGGLLVYPGANSSTPYASLMSTAIVFTPPVTVSGHVNYDGTALTSTNLSSCGTGSPAISATATDAGGYITEGTTSTGCTLAYALTYTVAPVCSCSAVTSGGVAVACGVSSTTPTTAVFVTASATGDVIAYTCQGARGST